MEIKGKKELLLYLTDWQTRMIKDFLGIECHVWRVTGGPVYRYGLPCGRNPKAQRMYLTDWQKSEIQDELGEACEFIELEKDLRVLYMGPPEVAQLVQQMY